MHRFFINKPLQKGGISISDKQLIHQLKDVLRLGKNDTLVLLDGSGVEAPAKIVKLHKKQAAFAVGAPMPVTTEPTRHVTLYLSILKRGNFELAIQKATEVGVKAIVPTIAERTVKTGLRRNRLERILKEAAEQSGRGIIPQLGDPLALQDAFAEAGKHESVLVFDPSGTSMPKTLPGNVGIFVGPEGGWSEDELEQANIAAQITMLGNSILRAETAAIVCGYVAINAD